MHEHDTGPQADDDNPQPTRAGFVALAGAPNVGKSTLLNRILDRRLSIATPKPQTTRARVLAVETRGRDQFVFLDTPGIHRPRGLMHERMVEHARHSLAEADAVCWIVDARRGLGGIDRDEAASLASMRLVLVVNKIDAVPKPELLPLMQELTALLPDAEIFPVSARTGEGVAELMGHLGGMLPQGPWFYDADTLSDQNERFFVAELVREQLFLQLREELPYRVAVAVESFEETKRNTRIAAVIYTDTDSSKAVLIGARGARVKEVGTAARRRIEEFLDRPVFLELFVKVKKGWREDPRFLEELGL
jgi:GTP-binding protein Era